MPNTRIRTLFRTTSIFCLSLLLFGAVAADAQKDKPRVEICDGIDNNGDGQIDEGFDVDGDGVARCCSCEPFFATVSQDGTRIDTYNRTCNAGGFTQGVQPAFQDFTGVTTVQLHAVADFDGNCGLDIAWRDANSAERHLTTCQQGEWQTVKLEHSEWTYFGGADLDANGTPDLVGWDASCCYTTANAGLTALNGGGGFPMFTPEIYNSYDVSLLTGSWLYGRAYNEQDIDGDAIADVMFWQYASGGASTTALHTASGLGNGNFGPTVTIPNTITNQPQNFGDLGDVDGDGCADWVGGPDDDGNKGSVYVLYGDCAGNFNPPNGNLLVDACVGCPGSGSSHGSGMSQLYDWDCDGDNDLLTIHSVTTGSTATVQYWDNPAWTPTTVVSAQPIRTVIASPLRNYDHDTCP